MKLTSKCPTIGMAGHALDIFMKMESRHAQKQKLLVVVPSRLACSQINTTGYHWTVNDPLTWSLLVLTTCQSTYLSSTTLESVVCACPFCNEMRSYHNYSANLKLMCAVQILQNGWVCGTWSPGRRTPQRAWTFAGLYMRRNGICMYF